MLSSLRRRALLVPLAVAACHGRSAPSAGSGSSSEPAVAPAHRAVAIAGEHACAIVPPGQVACWGRPTRGRLGHPDDDGGAPMRIALPARAISLAAGDDHTCALLDDGHVACWGAGFRKQLAGDDNANRPTPAIVAGLDGVIDVAAGGDTTCVLRANHHVACWGGDDDGQLGRAAGSAGCIKYDFSSDPGGTCDGTPTDVPGVTDAIAIALSTAYGCVVRADHTVACWGGVELTQLPGPVQSRPEPESLHSHALRPIAGITDAIAIATGTFGACVVRAGGTVACWGLVDPDGTHALATATDIPGLRDIVAIAVDAHACATDRAGKVWCWGNNRERQLGRDHDTDTPAPVPGLDGRGGVAVGRAVTCAETGDGKVFCVGNDYNGTLGTFGRDLPVVPVVGIAGATAIAAGSHHACAIVGGGAVRCWGRNDRGQVGAPRDDSMHELVMTSFPVPGIGGALELALGDEASCARTASGVACWGADVKREDSRGVWRADALDGATAIAASDRWVCGIVGGHVRCVQLETGETAKLARAIARASELRAIAVWAIMEIDRICVVDQRKRTSCWGHRLDDSGEFGTEMKYFHGLEHVRGLDGADRLVMYERELCAHTDRGIACHGGRDVPGAIDVAIESERCVVEAGGRIACEQTDEPGASGEPLEVEKLGPAAGIALGYRFACARDTAGAVRCVGTDEVAGDGRVMDRSMVPVEILVPRG